MPLSPAHPSVVLPLERLGLPLSALVVGAVAPDAPVFLPVGVSYETTHSGWGVPVDAAIGLVLLALWSFVVRDAVVDLAPPLRSRVPAHARPDRRAWLLSPLALAVGAATHVLWDSTTHDWGFVVQAFGALREQHGPIPLYRWLQHLSTVAGSAVVVVYGVRRLGRQPLVPRPPAVSRPGWWAAPVPAAALTAGVALQDAEAAVGTALLTALAVACAWRAARREP